ncbi:hypothetical protein Nepgr_019875 [Nepenthes gracilis]|uniref:non-specific serine/threonine protein kinase n=1 Tax=Nepenthes gracilis TaxID=150966 RepID=A0AAD3SWL6_NEPGR|nr:hypothetical protein Nepgr_019875 [Nepenthes gracilis]
MLVYEFVPNNTLEFHLHGKGQPTMDWPTRLKIALGAAKGLAYLHEDCHPKIIHCDIKASNILLDFNFEAKLADFGLAKFSSDANTLISMGVMGTFGYLAPEYASSGKLTDKSDVFSFGVVLMELVTGRQPVDKTQTFMEDSLVDWARPLLTRALEDETFESLVDPCLQNEYNHSDMVRMVACAASCVRHSARRRPRMNQIVRALEGDMSLSDLTGGIRPGHSSLYGSYGSSDYDSNQYKEDMKGFRKMALASQDFGSGSDHGGTTGEPSGLSSQGQTAQRDGDGKDEERQPRFQRNILQMMLRPSVSELHPQKLCSSKRHPTFRSTTLCSLILDLATWEDYQQNGLHDPLSQNSISKPQFCCIFLLTVVLRRCCFSSSSSSLVAGGSAIVHIESLCSS